jgi:hypothetical protein
MGREKGREGFMLPLLPSRTFTLTREVQTPEKRKQIDGLGERRKNDE